MKTERIAFGFVLVAWIVSCPLMPTGFHCAFVILTTSGGGGVPGVTVTVTVAVLPNQVAVIRTGVAAVTREVAMLNVLVERFWETTVSDGTEATAGLLLERFTTAPWVITPVNATVPVLFAVPMIVVGTADTDFSVGPGGGAGLTSMFAVRGTLSTAAVIWTGVKGAAALLVIVKNASVVNGGTTMLLGTWAAFGSLEKSRTVVGLGSANARVTSPVALAPLLTMLGATVRPLMLLAEASPVQETASRTASATTGGRTRRMGDLLEVTALPGGS